MSKFHEFPKMLYKLGHEPRTAHSQKEQDDFFGGWSETPVTGTADKGDTVDYRKGGEIAEAKTPIKDVHADEKTGADSKYGGDEKQGVKKEEAKQK